MSGQQDPNASKNDYAILWILALITIIGGLIVYFLGDYLKIAFLYIRKYQAMGASLFTDKLDQNIREIDQVIVNNQYDVLAFQNMVDLSQWIGSFWVYPSVGVLIIMALYLLKNNASMRWKTKHNMDTLIRQEQKNWPQIAPVVPLDLVDLNINEGPWAMAKNPMQYAKVMKLLEIDKVSDSKAAWKATENYRAKLIKEKAHRAFVNQMGPLWQGVNALPPHTKALFAIFAARCEHKADDARAYCGELAQNAAKGEMQYSRTEEFLKKYGNNKAVKRCTERHAYVYTVMASMLELARTDGVLASADFLWLKPVDRKLWYVLNTVGRQTAPVEIAGPWAHWLAEKEMHRALSVPMVEEAVKAYEKGLAQMVYVPDDDEEETDFPSETPEEV